MLFEEIEIGKTGQIELLLKGIQELVAKNGEPYQTFTCQDTSGNIKKIQNFKKLLNVAEVKLPLVISVNLRADLYMGQKTFLLQSLENGKLKVEDFLPKSQVNPRVTWGEIIKLIKTIKDDELRNFVCQVLENNKEKFKIMPLNKVAYNRTNGIMEATYKLMKISDAISKELSFLDREILVAAAAIFYVGQVNATDENQEYTENDVLLGPGVLSLQEIIKVEQSFKGNIDPSVVTLLKHLMIARNRGHYAAIPEAIALLYLDSLIQETEEVQNLVSTLGDNGYIERYYQHRSRLYKVPKKEGNNEQS